MGLWRGPNTRLGRRGFLTGLGATVPLLASWPGAARGASLFPKRFIVFCQSQGTLLDQMVAGGVSETVFDYGPILAALEPHRDGVVVIEGIDDQVNTLDGTYNGHTRCCLDMLPATGMVWRPGAGGQLTPTSAGGPSLDQVIAGRLAGRTAYPSLEFGCNASSMIGNTFLWRGVDEPVWAENDPNAMFDRLFGELVVASPAEIERTRVRRASVLDAVKANLAHVQSKLGADDVLKLESHLASVRALEQTLQGVQLGGACSVPAAPSGLADQNLTMKAQIDLMVMSLACDLTRVASLSSSGDPDWSWLNVDFPSGWHDAVHSGQATPDLQADLNTTYGWYTEQLAYLISALKAVPEGEGTLFDNTLILFANVFSDGATHSHQGKYYVLAGGAGGALTGGRLLSYAGDAHNDLFVSILNLLGFDDTTFGHPDFCTGPLAGLS